MAKNKPAQQYIRSLESEQSRTAMTSLLNTVARYFDPEKIDEVSLEGIDLAGNRRMIDLKL